MHAVSPQPAAKSVFAEPSRARPTFGTRIPGAKVDTPVVSTNRWVDTLACRLLRPESGSRIGPAFWFQNAARAVIDVFKTCCEGSWPMMPASGADQWWWPMLLASGVNSSGQWWWPVVLPSVAVQFAGQLGKFIARSAHSCTHMFECIVSSSSPSPSPLPGSSQPSSSSSSSSS